MIILLFVLSIWVLFLTYVIFKSKYKDDDVLDEDLEDDTEFEYETPTRNENMSVISMVFEIFNQSDPMTESGNRKKKSVINKCSKIAKRYADEIYDETFYVEKDEEN